MKEVGQSIVQSYNSAFLIVIRILEEPSCKKKVISLKKKGGGNKRRRGHCF
jgi:hypothetical protein